MAAVKVFGYKLDSFAWIYTMKSTLPGSIHILSIVQNCNLGIMVIAEEGLESIARTNAPKKIPMYRRSRNMNSLQNV
jgi:hypothetical protein